MNRAYPSIVFVMVVSLLLSASGAMAQASAPQTDSTLRAAFAGSGAAPSVDLPPSRPTLAGAAVAGQVITLTATGFTPLVLTTTVGAEVTWYNATPQTQTVQSGEPYQVFLPLVRRASAGLSIAESAMLPAAINGSDVYSGTLAPGGTFTHTFNSLGEFPYFAATMPRFRGLVVVQAPPLPDFALAAWPVAQSVAPGSAVTYTVAITALRGLTQSVSLTWGGYADADAAWAGNPVTPTATTTLAITPSVSGPLGQFALSITGTAGSLVHTTQVTLSVETAPGLPPDPGSVAPVVDLTVATDLASATAFLYTGNNPIQTGVISGTMVFTRVAVLRGKVLDVDGAALSGVTIAVLDHPEYGQTLSRADGMFDLAVNGGGLLTINYQKSGYLPSQRKVDAPWQDYAWLPDVVLIAADSNVTDIDLTSPAMQVAQGSVVSDTDGTRQATLLVPPGTTATLIFAGGVTQTLSSFHVRLTEYTAGSAGPQAMPGELPPQSAYTYAAEYTVDEALAAGAVNVAFSQALIHYSQNFLGFPVGMAVPTGYYDRVRGLWVASENGRVVKVITITAGLPDVAELDTDGDGVADNGSVITPTMILTITTAERQRLAELYTAGQELWRVPIRHFSPWDYNWPYGPPDDATTPNQPPPHLPRSPVEPDCDKIGSIIGCESQRLGQMAEIAGTPFRLAYSSDRVPGRMSARMEIPLSGDTIPASLAQIYLEVEVAGRKFGHSFGPAANLTYLFNWDGTDAYGRAVVGQQPVTVRIGYAYQAVYKSSPAQLTASFAMYGSALMAVKARQETIIWQQWQGVIGSWLLRSFGPQGWDLDVHHSYDPTGKVLHLGDGSYRSASLESMAVITTVAGGGHNVSDNIPATQAVLNGPTDVAVGPDGSLYIADYRNNLVRRVGPTGIITTVAGNDVSGYSGDGGPATQASLNGPNSVAVGPDGSLFIADFTNNRVRRVGPDGIITTTAGNGSASYSGDGGLATQASLNHPTTVAVGPDGSLYIVDIMNHRVRRVGPDGIITTVAGNGIASYSGDGGPATQASLNYPRGIAVGPDGSLFISDKNNSRIRRVGPDGIISTVAGTSTSGYIGDGGLATAAALNFPTGVTVGPDGNLYIADNSNYRIRRVGPDGTIATVVGNGDWQYTGEGMPATRASLNAPAGVAMGPDGSLYIADYSNNRIRQVAPALPGWGVADLLIPSEDGSELYHLSVEGRHLETLDALTGALRYRFDYDSAGRLTTVTDEGGNPTTIERDPDGNPTAIVSPYGQRTTLELDANGYVSRISNPADESLQLVSTADGLLTSLTDPRSQVYTYTYDEAGRLTREDDPAGGYKTLSRVESGNGVTVTLTTAEGRQTRYSVARLPQGGARRTVIEPSGATTVAVFGADGARNITYPDGSAVRIVEGPDPRWGMLAPIEASLVYTSPGGTAATRTIQRTVTLTDTTNPLSLASMTDQVGFDGNIYTSQYTAATHTITNISPVGRRTVTTLDAQGRVVGIVRDGEDPVTLTYDGQGQLTGHSQGARSRTFSYNGAGLLAIDTDAAGQQTRYGYTDGNRLEETTLPSNSLYSFGYDPDGNLTQVTPPLSATHALTYTAVDLQGSYTPPGGAALTWSYGPDQELTSASLPGGIQQVYSHDAAGRLAGLNYPGAALSFQYAGLTDQVTGITRVAPSGTQSVTFAYNGELLTALDWSGVATGHYAYTYGNSLRLASIRLDGDSPIALTRDADGLLTGYGPFTFARTGPGGYPTLISGGPFSATYNYNTLADLSGRSIAVAGQSLFQEQLVYSNTGRLMQKVETVSGTVHTLSYTYDVDGQLLSAWRDGIVAEQYAYDANGNRTSRKLGTNPLEMATYDGQDRLVQHGSVSYQFDAAGFLTSRVADTFAYSARGELVTATVPGKTITYAYDGLGRRVGRTDGADTYQYLYGNPDNPFQVTAIRDPSAVRTVFYYDEGGRLLAFQRGGTWYYVASDLLGTPRVVSDPGGTVVKSLAYDSFGRVVSDTNPAFDLPIGFAGGLADPATGLVRYGLRDYDPEAGRWTARDPVLFSGHQVNLYVYVGNNPVQLVDPLGLFSFGVNAYDGVGGGFKVAWKNGRFSICGEIGVGAGGGVEVDPFGGVDKTGGTINGELGVSVGFVGAKVTASEKTSGVGLAGCPTTITGQACAGPFCTNGDNVKIKGNWQGLFKNIGDLFKNSGAGVQAKLTYKQCAQW